MMDEQSIEILNKFVRIMDRHIDLLNGINGKLQYSDDYEQGYDDASHAIKNTMHTLVNKFSS